MAVLTNPRSDRVKSVRALGRRSVRERTQRFLVEGPQGVREAVRHAAGRVVDVYVTPEAAQRYPEIIETAQEASRYVHEVSDEVLAAMSETDTPQGIVAVVAIAEPTLAEILARRPKLLVVLTNVRDPGNAGTVIRGADAAGADAVIVSTNSVDVLSPKVVRSTAGSTFHIPVVTGLDIPEIIAELRGAGIRLLAADGSATRTIDEADLSSAHAWVMGNEAWGLEPEVRDACDEVLKVPIHGLAESLNLAMAATICLYASARVQRG
ncbi:TrmH family RNA methyltransferase [Kribbia dieselivorans]|uniref:TrmH family RNA methyltransferase n=1 Tax=Kribbia dieselivorans TaxID=331526 RepID=UPI000838570F|nr:RNA methyltransferase [Kribbia dieselivorans]